MNPAIILAWILPCLAFQFYGKPPKNPIIAKFDDFKDGVYDGAGYAKDFVANKVDKKAVQNWFKDLGVSDKASNWVPNSIKEYLSTDTGSGLIGKGKDDIKRKVMDVYMNVKGNIPLGDKTFTPAAPAPDSWSDERLALYLWVRGVDPNEYSRNEMAGVVTMLFGNVEGVGKFELILDSWSNPKLRQFSGNVDTQSHIDLVERAAKRFDEAAGRVHKGEKARQQYIKQTTETLKGKSLENFDDWTIDELANYLASYGADANGGSLLNAAKDNYYHFVYGFNNDRPNFMGSFSKNAFKAVARNFVPLPDLVFPMIGL